MFGVILYINIEYINLLTMSTIENVITDTVLIFLANFRNVTPYAINVVEEFIAAIAFVFLATQFTQTWYIEEGYHVYPWLQNDL